MIIVKSKISIFIEVVFRIIISLYMLFYIFGLAFVGGFDGGLIGFFDTAKIMLLFFLVICPGLDKFFTHIFFYRVSVFIFILGYSFYKFISFSGYASSAFNLFIMILMVLYFFHDLIYFRKVK